MEINNLLEDARGTQKSMMADAARLSAKWAQSGLLEGLGEKQASNMAVILENQAKQVVAEANTNTQGGAGFTAGSGENWAGVALPLVRKVFAQIVAQDFVSVQPMSLPSGLVFYLDFKYGDTANGRTDGENMYGNVTDGATKMTKDTDPSGGLYGAGKFGYTINSASVAVEEAAVAADSASISYEDGVDPANYYKITKSFSGLNADLKGVRAFRILSASTDVTNPKYTSVSGNDVTFVVLKTDTTVDASLTGSIVYHKQPVDNDRGDFEADSSRAVDTSISIPSIDVKLASEAIVAKTRKLKAQWTPEFSQDLNAFHSLDAEAELTNILSEYISLEIDLEILDMLIENVPTSQVAEWSAKVGNEINGAGTAFDSNTNGVYYTQMSWFQTLGIKLQKVSNIIHQRTLRGGANFMVVSPTVATILESIPGFAADTDGDVTKASYAFGVQKIGALNSRYKVYKNPYMTENTILMGFRGNQFLESGAVYAPYIPLIMTPLVYDPNTFTPRKGIMTRYAKKMVRPEFYGKVFVSDLDVV